MQTIYVIVGRCRSAKTTAARKLAARIGGRLVGDALSLAGLRQTPLVPIVCDDVPEAALRAAKITTYQRLTPAQANRIGVQQTTCARIS